MILKVTRSTKLTGDIYISGSKNASLPCICAALLTKKEVILTNVPNITDVNNLLKIISNLGVKVKRTKDQLMIQAKNFKWNILDELVTTLRGSYYLIGPVVSRYNKLKIRFPGGCSIGARPIDYHLKMLQELGYTVQENQEYLYIQKLDYQGKRITFPDVSVGATINTLLLTCKKPGKVIISNPSLEPEVLCVMEMLNKMGACIYIKDKELVIEGVKELFSVKHQIIFDRMEAGSYLFLAGAVPNSKVVLHNVEYKLLKSVIVTARFMGIKIQELEQNKIIIEGSSKIRSINLLVGIYPFFPTDLQQIVTVVLTKASKTSKIEDPIFPTRTKHLKELRKLGAYVYEHNQAIYIKPSIIFSSKVRATDLRGAFSLVLAGVLGNRTTYISDIDYLFRGYEDVINKLKSIGVNVELL